MGWKQHFRAMEAFGGNSDDVSVWVLVGLLDDVLNNLPSERVPSVSENLHKILCKITANQTKDGEMQSVTFIDGTVCETSVRLQACRVSGSRCTWRTC